VELARPGDVVGVGALPCEEAEILLAAHSRADAEIAHGPAAEHAPLARLDRASARPSARGA